MPILKRVRVIKKIQEGGAWRFVSLEREGKRYVWDPRPGTYYLKWWDGGQRLREVAGGAPSRAITARRRKQLELGGDAPGDSAVAPHAKVTPTFVDPDRGWQKDAKNKAGRRPILRDSPTRCSRTRTNSKRHYSPLFC